MNREYDVCIVGLKCLDYLERATIPRYLGGIEKQLVALARGMQQQGLRVAFLTYDHGGPKFRSADGIDIYSSFSPSAGLPVLRFFFPRFVSLFLHTFRIRAKMVVQMGAGSETGTVALGCLLNKHAPKFLFLVASNADCHERSPSLKTYRERVLFRYGLAKADLVVSQTETQREMLTRNLGIESVIGRLPIAVPELAETHSAESESRSYFALRCIWVGRFVEVKRPDWLVHAATSCPDIEFNLVGDTNNASDYATGIVAEVEKHKNIVHHGKLSDRQLAALYESSDVLLCTSSLEGFPTTFVEAWANSLPVLTSFDPDMIVRENDLGLVFTSKAGMVAALESMKERANRKRIGLRGRAYFDAEYSPRVVTSKLVSMLSHQLFRVG